MMKDTDKYLIKAVQEGNILSYEILVKKYQGKLISFVKKYVWNEKDAEEIVQDTFFSIYRNIEKVDIERKFSSYLFTAAKNTSVSFLRTNKLETRLNEQSVSQKHDIVDGMEKEETKKEIKMALSSINPKYSKPLSLYFFYELSYQEISIKLKIPLNTVRTYIRRGKMEMKQKLDKATFDNNLNI
ncbi:MAG: RNA polymerase sigma factor RpoE [Candidatus Gottesmanbacteria bacterium GW2011_GWC2_39_8]|uniref:RNA polymerase sigma factor RpoE n=1 Tax=Candidatus Gottesmanbacteria bacterium GW2011_GWC2_39_8 TaxID=1618450 RepID=A0A0G0S8P1_9BACT|nr:MAG: RNA polymerase sigma factor RpoE [Candidatus Gottesmanbacteria bacterium GW2011_GWC2_39_8]